MKQHPKPLHIRPVVLILLVLSMIVLGLGSAAWATPLQSPLGQTIPPDDDDDDDGPSDEEKATATAWVATTTAEIATRTAIAEEQTAMPGDGTPVPGGETPTPTPEPVTELILPPWIIIISPDDFDFPVTLTGETTEDVAQIPDYTCPPTQVNFAVLDLQGNPVAPEDFVNPIEVRVQLSPEQIEQAGGDPSQLVILVYDLVRQVWVDLQTTLNPDGSVSVFVNYSGRFAVCAVPEVPVELPVTGVEEMPIPAMLPDTGGGIGGLTRWGD
jgi:hypothetical protein